MEEQLWYGKYQPLSLLSASNGAEVFLVYHVGLDEKRIIKRVEKGSRAEEMLRREAYVLGRAGLIELPHLYDLEESSNEVAIIEEYLEGETLEHFMNRKKVLGISQIKQILLSICEIITALQNRIEGFVHCDLQPANIIIHKDKLKVIDFGASVSAAFSENTLSFGTKGFCAPEQEMGQERDERADVYALGRILLQLLHFTPDEISLIDRAKKQGLERIAKKASSSSASDRYQAVYLLAEALRKCRGFEKSGKRVKLPRQTSLCTIGIAGTHHGVGVTHTALSLAWYLSNLQNKKVALVDMSESKALGCFGSNKENGPMCRVGGFNVFPAADSLLMGTIRSGNYDYCILDLGCCQNRRFQELLRCDRKLIVSDSAPWRKNRRDIIESFISKVEQPDDWWLILNLSGRNRIRDCENLPIRTVKKQFSQDLFDTAAQNENLYGKILSAN